MEKEFITFKEAAKLANVSSMTIRRLAYQWLKDDNPEISENVIVLNHKNPTGKIYKIAKDKVLKHFALTPDKEQDKGKVKEPLPKVKGASTFRLKAVLSALEKSNDLLIEQLRVKDRQLDARDRHISDLSERLRESHILLLSPPKTKPEPTVFEHSDIKEEENREGEAASAPEPEIEQTSEPTGESPEAIYARGPQEVKEKIEDISKEEKGAQPEPKAEEVPDAEREPVQPPEPGPEQKRGLFGWLGR